MPALLVREGVSASVRAGEYWDKRTQIDVVAMRDDGFIELGECKWGTIGSPGAVARELEEKIPYFPNPKNATIKRRLFLKSKPKASVANVTVVDLETLLGT
jgi:hypothetical protein